tara:strand:+ start:734 stop:1816 length:1083 start_codon:yes stop_codon:yes gene_type:complete
MNVLTSITVLGLLILFHEAGHFFAARSQGIHVNGFSIGFGPAIFKKEINGVIYALRALPLGGFVSFPDEENDPQISKDDPNLLQNRPIAQRAFVISAGVLANLLIAWLVLAYQATVVGLPNEPDPGVMVLSVQPNEAAIKGGLLAGDQIIGINNHEIGKGEDAVKILVKEIQGSPNKSINLEIVREDNIKSLMITPSDSQGQGRVGAQLQQNISGVIRPTKNIGEIINYTDKQFVQLLFRTIQGYQGLFTDFNNTAKQMSGPIKIVEIGAQLSQQGQTGIVLFTALISINLAVINSLPLPLLDGGQLMILLLEGIRGRPIPQRIQLIFMQSGLLLLVGLSVVLMIRDTSQLSLVQQLINK